MRNFEGYLNERGLNINEYKNIQPLPGWITNQIKKSKPKFILDFGCGYGQTILSIKKQFPEIKVFGHDIDKESKKVCKNKNIDFFNRIQDIPNNYFDMVLSMHVFEHVDDNQINLIFEQLKRILKHNGFLLIAVPNAQSLTGVYWLFEDHTHLRLYTANSLLRLLRFNNFSNVKLLDRYATEGHGIFFKVLRLISLKIVEFLKILVNKLTSNNYHMKGFKVFTYEVKAMGVNIKEP